MTTNIHASCVALGRQGVLLLGGSGAGKSDLALRLIDDGASLVADDRTELWTQDDRLLARAPRTIAGLMEVRGLGIVKLPYRRQIRVALAVELGRPAKRLPEVQFFEWRGAAPVPLLAMDGREASAAAKIRLVLANPGLFTQNMK